MVSAIQVAVTPGGKPLEFIPFPKGKYVVCVIGVNTVLIQSVGVEDAEET